MCYAQALGCAGLIRNFKEFHKFSRKFRSEVMVFGNIPIQTLDLWVLLANLPLRRILKSNSGAARPLESDVFDPFGDQGGAQQFHILLVEGEVGSGEFYKNLLSRSKNVLPLRSHCHKLAVSMKSNALQFEVVGDLASGESLLRKSNHNYSLLIIDLNCEDREERIRRVSQIQKVASEAYVLFLVPEDAAARQLVQQFASNDLHHQWDSLVVPCTESELKQKSVNLLQLWSLSRQVQNMNQCVSRVYAPLLNATHGMAVRGVLHSLMEHLGSKLELVKKVSDPGAMRTEDQSVQDFKHITDICLEMQGLIEYSPETMPWNPHLVDLKGLLDLALSLSRVGDSGGDFKICFIKSEEVSTQMDPFSMIVGLQKIIDHSVLHSGTPGQLDISIEFDQQRAKLTFRDYGKGLSRSELEELKKETYSVEHPTSGLALSRFIVEEIHAGKLEIGNHGVKGLQVVVWLPLDS
jgi:signal transduction histidine kinase